MQTTKVDEQVDQGRRMIEDLEPGIQVVERVFMWPGADGNVHPVPYTQETLGMFPAQEWMNMMLAVVRDLLVGKYGIKIGELFKSATTSSDSRSILQQIVPEALDEDSVNKVVDSNIDMIQAFLNLITIVPDLLHETIALSLGVRRKQREWFKDQISEPPSRGGLTVDEGFDILGTFVRQNGDSIRRFLGEKIQDLYKEVMATLPQETEPEQKDETETPTPKTDTSSPGSTPSSTSSQDIPASV